MKRLRTKNFPEESGFRHSQNKWRRKFLIFIFGFTFLILHFTLNCFAEDKIVAIVNNEIITQKDLDDFIHFTRLQYSQELSGEKLEAKIQSMKLDLIDKLIEDRLILQEAKKNNSMFEIAPKQFISIKPDEGRVKARLEDVKSRYGSEREFLEALAKQGITQADVEKKVREQLLMYNMVELKVRSRIKVNPSEVTSFFQQHEQDFKLGEQREVEIISVQDENIAKEVAKRLKNQEKLDDLAEQYGLTVSKLSASRDGKLRKDFEEAIFNLQPDGVSSPLSLDDTYYIFKLDVVLPARQQTLSEVREKIYSYLNEEKIQERLSYWIEEVRKRSYIKVLES